MRHFAEWRALDRLASVMKRFPRCLLGRLLTALVFAAHLLASGEQVIPDAHDWHGPGASAVVAASPSPARPSPSSPQSPVHVCHDGHQHTAALITFASLPVFASVFSEPVLTVPGEPSAPPPRSFFRPPIT